MNKKVLVLTLALVVAFASSAMADVKFTGKFEASAEQNNFKIFQESFEIKSGIKLTLGASSKSETDEVLNWDLTADLGTDKGFDGFALGKYKLGLYDDYFTAYVWGEKYELTKKATYFDMIAASSGKDEGGHRARVEVPVMDLGKVTADFRGGNNLRLFAEGKVDAFDLGLAYARKGWKTEGTTTTATDVIVGQVGTSVPAGDLAVNLKGAAGVTLGDELGLALGFGADSQITDELKLEASVTNGNKTWAGDDVKARNTVLKAGATYEEAAYKATASVTHTLISEPVKEDENDVTVKAEKASENKISLGLAYRFSETVAYDDLFKADKYYTNDAPAVKAFADLTDFGFGEVGVEVAAPVVADMIWAKAYAKYGAYSITDYTAQLKDGNDSLWVADFDAIKKDIADNTKPADDFVDEFKTGYTTDETYAKKYTADSAKFEQVKGKSVKAYDTVAENNFQVGADLYIAATSKLTVKPYAYYKNLGKVLTLGSKVDYKIGLSDTVLGLEVKKVTADDSQRYERLEQIKASITVAF